MIQWTAEPTWGEPLHVEIRKGPGRTEGKDAAELGRAEPEKEKGRKEAAAEGLDMLGDGRGRKIMLHRWAKRLKGEGVAMAKCLDRKLRGAAGPRGAH